MQSYASHEGWGTKPGSLLEGTKPGSLLDSVRWIFAFPVWKEGKREEESGKKSELLPHSQFRSSSGTSLFPVKCILGMSSVHNSIQIPRNQHKPNSNAIRYKCLCIIFSLDSPCHCSLSLVQIIKTGFLPKEKLRGRGWKTIQILDAWLVGVFCNYFCVYFGSLSQTIKYLLICFWNHFSEV